MRNSYVIVRQSIEILFLTILIIYSCRKIVLLFHYENILKAGDSDLTHSRCYLHCIYMAVKEVFQAFRYRDDKKKLKALMLEDPAYQSLPGDTVEIITELLNLEELAEESIKHMEKDEYGREHYNMCKAWIEIKEEEQKIGRERGDNNRTGIVVTNMLRRGYSTEDICAIAECSEQLVDELRKSLSE